MNGKLKFGCDYLNIMRNLEVKAKPKYDAPLNPVSDAAARLFLLNWGFSKKEIEDANQLFWDRFNNKNLDDFAKVIDRVIDFIKDDKVAQERFFVELFAIFFMDAPISKDALSEEVKDYFSHFIIDILNMKESEYTPLVYKGKDLALALNIFGYEFIKNRKPFGK
jgi:hypothetical protein